MLTVRGLYENGKVKLLEDVAVEGVRQVLVTFLDDEDLVVVPGPAYDQATRQLLLDEMALTSREVDVLGLMQGGLTNREIAIELSLSPGTIRNYTSSIYDKLEVRNRLEAVNRALSLGLLNIDTGSVMPTTEM